MEGSAGMQISNLLSTNMLDLPLLLLYAETHFRFFRWFPSLLFKKEPEVLFDLPRRIEPGSNLPVLLIINDIRMYPDSPGQVAIAVSQKAGNGSTLFTFLSPDSAEVTHSFKDNQRVCIFEIPEDQIPEGEFFVTATVTMNSGKKSYTVLNDNLNTSSKRAFRCYKSPYHLPGNELCSYGDLHVHSRYSQSHVEFGPPIGIIDKMAKCCGLSFAGITDHSYDLSCDRNDYLTENQSLERWKNLSRELSEPEDFSTILLQGEEVSCLNRNGKTVHLGALGISNFIPGSSDGARRNLLFKQSLTIPEAITSIHRQGGIAFAAHPGSRSGLLQSIFLGRGQWEPADCEADLDGLQSFNGSFLASWKRAKLMWINMLATGRRVPLLAGNDAHGDFNRYRAVRTPFLSIYENFQRFMGYGKTGIYGKCTTGEEVLQKIRSGATFTTTGPYISINYSDQPADSAVGNHTPHKKRDRLFVHALTTREFGMLRTLSVYSGGSGSREKPVFSTEIQPDVAEVNIPVSVTGVTAGSYVRAEVTSRDENGELYQAFSSPCWR